MHKWTADTIFTIDSDRIVNSLYDTFPIVRMLKLEQIRKPKNKKNKRNVRQYRTWKSRLVECALEICGIARGISSFKWTSNQWNKLTKTENGERRKVHRRWKAGKWNRLSSTNACISLNFIYNNQSFSHFTFFFLWFDVHELRVLPISLLLLLFERNSAEYAVCTAIFAYACRAAMRCDVCQQPTHLYILTEEIINHQIYPRCSLYLATHGKKFPDQNYKFEKWKYLDCSFQMQTHKEHGGHRFNNILTKRFRRNIHPGYCRFCPE